MKIRQSFVANSSSSSFLVVGKYFNTNEEAEEFKAKNKCNDYDITSSETCDGEAFAGIDINPGMDEMFDIDAEEFLEKLSKAISKAKSLGIERPLLIGRTTHDN